MKEQLQVALAEVINTTLQAKDFIVAETPDVIRQLLLWKMTEAIIYSVICLMVLGICAYGIPKSWKKLREIDEGLEPVMMFWLIPILGGCLPLLQNTLVWVQIVVAPKVYLLEYAKDMVVK
jgi:hypothetical protein